MNYKFWTGYRREALNALEILVRVIAAGRDPAESLERSRASGGVGGTHGRWSAAVLATPGYRHREPRGEEKDEA